MPLDTQYLQYCQPGNPFYAPAKRENNTDGYDVTSTAPKAWRTKITLPWVNLFPSDWTFPRQGWKIHISATPLNARRILTSVSRYCFDNNLPFKHLAGPAELITQNGKYADRSASGKFITIYPSSNDQFTAAVYDLDVQLSGEDGPYILSDRRWKSGPVYFRYGAFVPPANPTNYVSTLIDPDGNEVEDIRRPAFTPPAWATIPDEVTSTVPDKDVHFGFEIRSAMHFSNAGGVYLAEATDDQFVATGTPVVLKEARPHAGLDANGIDATARILHEETVLKALQGLPCVPAYYGSFVAWEHRYLVMEYIEGNDLKREWMTRTPVLHPIPWHLDNNKYTRWLDATVSRLDTALASIHEAGWLLGDIHPKNVLMRNGTDPYFIDFEFAHRMDPSWRCAQGAPGYEPLFGLAGISADRWALGILKLDLVYPQATIADQGNTWKIDQLLRCASKQLAVPEPVIASINTTTLAALPGTTCQRAAERTDRLNSLSDIELRNEVLRGIQGLVNWDGDGPVIPADIAIFRQDHVEHRAGHPYGAAGVIDLLHRFPWALNVDVADGWLAQRVPSVQSRGLRGRDGIEYVARAVGLPRTIRVIDETPAVAPTDDPTLWSGWAGVGLAEYALGGDPSEAAHFLKVLLDEHVQGESVGLLNGWCAAAILFARLHKATGDGRYVDLATQAIEADLSRCTWTNNGTLEFDEGWRTLPYLGVGSLGAGLAILELQHATDSDMFSNALDGIDAAACYYQCGQASLAHGLAGFLTYLTRRVRHRPSVALEDVIASHMRSLRLHAIIDDTGVFFRGNQNLRLSADYLTGAGGILAALQEVVEGEQSLPFRL